MGRIDKPVLSATQLAQLGKCEKQILLNKKYGSLYTSYQQQRINQGNKTHAHYAKTAQKETDSRCFIATAIYGVDAPQVIKLRMFRDQVLLNYPVGRLLVCVYYIISPSIAKLLDRCSIFKMFTKKILDKMVDVLC